MKKIILLAALAAVVLTGCKSVPISGRKQLSLVDDSQVLASSLTSYKSYMSTAAVSKNATQSAQVTRVGRKIAAATEAYQRALERSGQFRMGIQPGEGPGTQCLLYARRQNRRL